MPDSRAIPPTTVRQEGLLRRSLAGEYLALGLMLHAGIGALVWGAAAGPTPATLAVVAAGCWVCGRAAGAFAHRLFTPLVSAGLLAALLVVRPATGETSTPELAAFSWQVFAAMLALVFLVDLAEAAASPVGSRLSQTMRRWNWPRIALWGSGIAFVGYLILIPTIEMIIGWMTPPKSGPIEDMSLAEHVQIQCVTALTAAAFFAFGAAIGSFLNVVVYRAPRGESVFFQRSKCPGCGAQIEGRHNVPILGWLRLGGRCPSCTQAISPRYPIVEAIAGALFLLLYFAELISGGDNIPVRRPNLRDGVVWIIFYTKWDIVGLYLFHCLATTALLTWALIDFDRQRIPSWLRWLAGATLAALPAVLPHLLPVAWLPVAWSQSGRFLSFLPEWTPSSTLETTLVGGLVGALLGWTVSRVTRDRDEPRGHAVSAGLIVGLSLGWQAAVGVWLLTLVLRPIAIGAARGLNLAAPPITLLLLVAYLVQLIGWRATYASWWPSGAASPTAWAVVGCLFVALGLLNRSLRDSKREPSNPLERTAFEGVTAESTEP